MQLKLIRAFSPWVVAGCIVWVVLAILFTIRCLEGLRERGFDHLIHLAWGVCYQPGVRVQ